MMIYYSTSFLPTTTTTFSLIISNLQYFNIFEYLFKIKVIEVKGIHQFVGHRHFSFLQIHPFLSYNSRNWYSETKVKIQKCSGFSDEEILLKILKKALLSTVPITCSSEGTQQPVQKSPWPGSWGEKETVQRMNCKWWPLIFPGQCCLTKQLRLYQFLLHQQAWQWRWYSLGEVNVDISEVALAFLRTW